ncbi:unnamed protein product [Phytophthora fragariaefolia]|uniref:Unnamed protein product n=1 Tax=Phytophthora fragariaefolia TaxID=1490495 RepID=A0A9W7CW96_9STRA|nr:unnamed protein product [Phytophthora fragariaefolia]
MIPSEALANDGVLGLAFAGMSKINHPNIVDAVQNSNSELVSVFAFHLTNEAHEDRPEFHFGGYDLSVAGEGTALANFPVMTLPSEFKTD